jgi:hypothetical protein
MSYKRRQTGIAGLRFETRHVNADNDFLGYRRTDRDGHVPIGYADEVNGELAEEMPFMPTKYELLMLVKHWTKVELDNEFGEFFLFPDQARGSSMRRSAFANRRITRIEELLGPQAVEKAAADALESFGQQQDRDAWQVFLYGSEQEQEAFQERFRRERNALESKNKTE